MIPKVNNTIELIGDETKKIEISTKSSTMMYINPSEILEIGIANRKYIDIVICRARATKEDKNWNSLKFEYIKEYPDSGTVPVGHLVMYWGVYYIIVEDYNDIEYYVNEMKEKIGNSGGGRWCFVFDKDTPNNILVEYSKLLYPNEKIKIVKQDENRG